MMATDAFGAYLVSDIVLSISTCIFLMVEETSDDICCLIGKADLTEEKARES